jgi:hypothetical protein
MLDEDALMLNRSTLNRTLMASPDCLTLQELEKLAGEPSLSHPHLGQCPRCQAELALLKSFESSTPIPDEGAAVAWISARLERQLSQIKNPSLSRPASSSLGMGSWFSRMFEGGSARWLVPVTALIVIAGASALLLRQSHEPDLRANAGNGPVVYRSQEVEVTSPAGEVAEAPKALQWKPFGGAAEYKISMMEVDEAPLWAGQTHDVVLTIPTAVRSKMLPGKPVLWRVTALDSRGHVLAVSQVQRFSVRRKSPGSTSEIVPK